MHNGWKKNVNYKSFWKGRGKEMMIKRNEVEFNVIVTLRNPNGDGGEISDEEMDNAIFHLEMHLNDECSIFPLPRSKGYARFHAVRKKNTIF
jgi:hypothetical protein